MSVPSKTQLTLPETEQVEQKIASLNLKGATVPLKLGHSLDAFKRTDLTPIIGTEFERGIQLAELLKAPNANELVKDLAVLSMLSYLSIIATRTDSIRQYPSGESYFSVIRSSRLMSRSFWERSSASSVASPSPPNYTFTLRQKLRLSWATKLA